MIQHTGSAELTIEGKNLKDTLRLLHDGIEYTPLASTENSVTFILGDNGTNRVYVNGEYSFGVQVTGVVVPGVLPTRLQFTQTAETAFPTIGRINNLSVNGYCINYPYIISPAHANFRLAFPELSAALDENAFGFNNCSLLDFGEDGTNSNALLVAVTDPTKPAYITYHDFIIAVFNYE